MGLFKKDTLFSMKGARQLQKAFDKLEKKAANKVARQAMRKALAPIRTDAKRRCPIKEVARAIKIRAWPKRKRNMIGLEVRIGDKEVSKKLMKAARKAEYGSKDTPATPFIRPAIDSKGREALKILTTEIGLGIKRELKS